jgi:hypothetical protein
MERPRRWGKRGTREAREGDARRVRGAGSRVDVLFSNAMSREGETGDVRARRGLRLTEGARDDATTRDAGGATSAQETRAGAVSAIWWCFFGARS